MPIWILIPVGVIVWLAVVLLIAQFLNFNDRTLDR